MLGHGDGPFVLARMRPIPLRRTPDYDAAVTALRRRTDSLVLVTVLAMLFAACGSSVSPSPRPSLAIAVPDLTPVPGGPSQAAATPAPSLPGQTHTEFGLIWDALPPSFPIPAGAIVTDARE